MLGKYMMTLISHIQEKNKYSNFDSDIVYGNVLDM